MQLQTVKGEGFDFVDSLSLQFKHAFTPTLQQNERVSFNLLFKQLKWQNKHVSSPYISENCF